MDEDDCGPCDPEDNWLNWQPPEKWALVACVAALLALFMAVFVLRPLIPPLDAALRRAAGSAPSVPVRHVKLVVKLLIDFCQIVGSFDATVPVPWPPAFNAIRNKLSISKMSFIRLPGIACIFPDVSFYKEHEAFTVGLAVSVGAMAATYAAVKLLARFAGGVTGWTQKQVAQIRSLCINRSVVFMYVGFVAVSQVTLQMFYCRDLGAAGSFLVADCARCSSLPTPSRPPSHESAAVEAFCHTILIAPAVRFPPPQIASAAALRTTTAASSSRSSRSSPILSASPPRSSRSSTTTACPRWPPRSPERRRCKARCSTRSGWASRSRPWSAK